MNIWIENNAIQPDSNDFLFRKEFLFGLRYLQKFGHSMGFNSTALSAEQITLINQENIANSNFSREEADLTVTAGKGGNLVVKELDITENRWGDLSHRILFPARRVSYRRKTGETEIDLELNLDGTGESDISTGLSFFDHMLDQIARHGLIDLKLTCKGDLEVDEHHTIEDVGIALGQTIKKALGDKRGIQRYAFVLPMDEAQSRIALDFSGRPFLVFNASLKREYVGDFPTEMLEHFFYSLAVNMGATLHITLEGENEHHIIESAFKGFARTLRVAVRRDEQTLNLLPSSKGVL